MRVSAVSARAGAVKGGEDRGTATAGRHAKNLAVTGCAAVKGRPIKGLALCAERHAGVRVSAVRARAGAIEGRQYSGTAAAGRDAEDRARTVYAALFGRPIKGLAVRAERQAGERPSAVSARAEPVERGADCGTAAAGRHAKDIAVTVCAAVFGRPIKGLAVRAERQAGRRGSAVSARVGAIERGKERGTAAADRNAKDFAVAVCAAGSGRPIKGLAVRADVTPAHGYAPLVPASEPLNEARSVGLPPPIGRLKTSP